jgi:hypothetical protein
MLRLPRVNLMRALCTTTVSALALSFTTPTVALAQDAVAPATQPAMNADLRNSVDTFWHYGKVGRYDLATAEGQKLLSSGAQPQEILEAFESVTSERKDNLDAWMQRWLAVPQMQDVTNKLVDVQAQGYRARAGNPTFIEQHVQRLANGERAYGLALNRLRESGELAVPLMIDYLRDPAKSQYHSAIRRALREMGRLSLSPLVAATQMKDAQTLTTVVMTLGDLGYDTAVPYLARLVNSKDTADTVKQAATDSIKKLNGDPAASTGDLFYQLAEKFYYDKATLASDPRKIVQPIWYWDETKGLIKIDVVPAIYSELMCMRACEYALDNGRGGDAQSLWLAANYKRDADLPTGTTDPTRGDNQPSPHFYGVTSGAQYLNVALARALNDHNPAVALRVLESLFEISGQSNVFAAAQSQPIVDAMSYPERAVRFEAALTAAAGMPQQSFQGQERVVPLLAEAVSQTGQTSVIVVLPSADKVNSMVDEMKTNGFAAVGGTSAESAVAAAAVLPAVDVVVVSQEIGDAEIDKLFDMLRASPKLGGAARIVITKSNVSVYETRKVDDQLLSTSQATDVSGLKPAIESARARAGSLPMSADVATAYATRAAQQLAKLATSHSTVLNPADAKTSLLAALSDTRPEIVKLSGTVLSLINDKEAQAGLFTTADDSKTAQDLRISLYKSLAINAKTFGNQLDANQVDSLQKTVSTEANLDVRNAAAEAHGALNLPPDEAKTLIIQQSRK